MNTIKNILLKILGPFILSKSKIIHIEDISDKLRILTIKGKSHKKANWIAGQKVTLKLSDKEIRSYTPINWNKKDGTFQTIVFLHNNGPLSKWASKVKLNSKITVMGPRASLVIEEDVESIIFYGDETTFGLAAAIRDAHFEKSLDFIFESNSLVDSKTALKYLNFQTPNLINTFDINITADLILQKYHNAPGVKKIILTGKQQNMVKIKAILIDLGVDSKDVQMKVYWGWKDDPNGKLKLI